MATVYNARRSQVWRHIYLPHIRPVLFGAMRIGLAVSWKLALVAEVFGTATGVGVAVNYHFEAFDTGMMIAWAVPIIGAMLLADRLLRWSEHRAAQKRGYDTEMKNLIA
jgi:ABC-type nitrate/sulfonate/bicarbonate transport system, permease component